MVKSQFQRDLETWHQVALEAHQRPVGGGNIYANSQGIVEGIAHRQLAQMSARHRSVLEIGVGGGEHIAHEIGNSERDRYIALELDASFAQLVHTAFALPVVRSDAAVLPFPDASFDAVLASSVLEHLPDLSAVFKETDRILKPGGELLAIIPTNGSLALAAFKACMTYPYLRLRGIRHPALVWHYENVNHLLRIEALLRVQFTCVERISSPWAWLPWQLSPLALLRAWNP
jgi:SAM-dependent methyltransferase